MACLKLYRSLTNDLISDVVSYKNTLASIAITLCSVDYFISLDGTLMFRTILYTLVLTGGLYTIAAHISSQNRMKMTTPLDIGILIVFEMLIFYTVLTNLDLLDPFLKSVSSFIIYEAGLLVFSARLLLGIQEITAQADRNSIKPSNQVEAYSKVYIDIFNIFVRIPEMLLKYIG